MAHSRLFLEDASTVDTMSHGDEPWCHGDAMVMRPDGEALALACRNGEANILGIREPSRVRIPCEEGERVFHLDYSHEGLLAVGKKLENVDVLDREGGRLMRIPCSQKIIGKLVFSPGGDKLLVVHDDGWCEVWQVPAGERLQEGRLVEDWSTGDCQDFPNSAVWRPLKRSGKLQTQKIVWRNNEEFTLLATINTTDLIKHVRLGPGATISVEDLPAAAVDHVDALSWRPDGGLLATCGWPGRLRVWREVKGELVQVANILTIENNHGSDSDSESDSESDSDNCYSDNSWTLEWSPDICSGLLVTRRQVDKSFAYDTVKVWDIQTSTCLHTLYGNVRSMSFHPSGQLIAICEKRSVLIRGKRREEGQVKVWRVEEGTLHLHTVCEVKGHKVTWQGNQLAIRSKEKVHVFSISATLPLLDLRQRAARAVALALKWREKGRQEEVLSLMEGQGPGGLGGLVRAKTTVEKLLDKI